MSVQVSMKDLIKHFGLVDRVSGRNNGLEDLIYEIAPGWNPTKSINDCETAADWTESDNGTFDIAADSGDTRTGTNMMGMTATAACDNSQYVETDLIDGSAKPVLDPITTKRQISLEDFDFIGGWQFAAASGDFGTAGEMQFALVNDGVLGTKINLQAATYNVHQRWECDISGEDRDKVEKIRFYCNNANAAEALNIEDIIAYKQSNGLGPMWTGPCKLPVASTQVIVRGGIAQVDVDTFGVALTPEAASAVNTLGFTTEAATGVATGKVFAKVIFNGTLMFARAGASHGIAAGEGVIWKSATTITGSATGVDEQAIAKALEAPGADTDDILILANMTSTFIS